MAPKKKDAKSEKGQQKAELKMKQKIVEDKTFGLKNKNKSKAVQKYIKGVASTVQGPLKGGEQGVAAKHLAEKDEKKKTAQQEALLASLFKGTENIKKITVDETGGKALKAYDPKASREEQKISLYTDQRDQKDNMEGWDLDKLQQVIQQKHSAENANATDIVCKYFLEAVEKRQYGWFWICPNGGDNCKYRHCLPPGYVLKSVVEEPDDEEEDEEPMEERIERERQALPLGGTPVTLETFTAWKLKVEQQRKDKLEAQRQAEAKRTGTRALHILSGKDLFAYDPSLFFDDEGAAAQDDYNEDEEAWQEAVAENQTIMESHRRKAEGTQEEETESDSDWQVEDVQLEDSVCGDSKREEDAAAINEKLFIDENDQNLPDDLDLLDD